jgi:GMP synthase (glutamine-hydrolysing)
MAIVIFQHSPVSAPGRIGSIFLDLGFKLDIRRLDRLGREGVPPDFDDVHGVISLGGPQNVGEDHPWLGAEISYLREAHRLQLPVVGVCLGAQLIAHALGGQVGPMGGEGKAAVEWGFTRVSIGAFGQVETMLAGIPWDSHQFQAHGQEVKQLPPESTLLAGSAACRVQAFRSGIRTYGFQYHFECTREMIERFVATDTGDMQRAGVSAGDVSAQTEKHYEMFARSADRLCENLATFLFPLQRKITV